jgi:uncharacterized membrane protein YoaK (UPF0700 family)
MQIEPPHLSSDTVIPKKRSRAFVSFVVGSVIGGAVGAVIGDVRLWVVIGFNVGAAVGLYLDRRLMKPKALWGSAAVLGLGFSAFLLTR